MAPKKKGDKAKKEKVEEGPPPLWVPAPSAVDSTKRDGTTITHLRAGRQDAVRGVHAMTTGQHRLTYTINSVSSQKGYGLLLGVCDAAAWEASEQRASALAQGIVPSKDRSCVPREFVAWGLCPSSGRLMRTGDLCKGHMQGATVGQELAPKPGSKGVCGMTVVVEVNMTTNEPSSQEAAWGRRTFSKSLHPLDMRGARHGEPARRPSTLSFSVNGGPFVEADVTLPTAVWPWVLLGWEGDAVTLEAAQLGVVQPVE